MSWTWTLEGDWAVWLPSIFDVLDCNAIRVPSLSAFIYCLSAVVEGVCTALTRIGSSHASAQR